MNFLWRSLVLGRETWRRGPARGLRIREWRCYRQHRLCIGERGSDRLHCLWIGKIRGCLRLVVRRGYNLSDLFGKEIAKRVWETGRELPAEAPTPARSAKKRALTAPAEGEGDFEEFRSEIRNSMKEVRESVQSLQGAVMTLVEAVAALTGRVNTIETREQSSRVNLNNALSSTTKLFYLRRYLAGDAAAPIAGLPTSDLVDAINILKESFGDRSSIEQYHLVVLRNIAMLSEALTSEV
ncbi:hypothetical protein HPB50_014365 [Hyalomma asiaticum]|uniref:Uncharacterized protein n=1 Tax=Hyalomma asiaticum TaxID=266040 RepID=A0ACB7SFF0_HYAAI|nr:hypothetical protein HPB50_014365 [Hyalomma asiaticum]